MLLQYRSNIFYYNIMYGFKYTNKRFSDGIQKAFVNLHQNWPNMWNLHHFFKMRL